MSKPLITKSEIIVVGYVDAAGIGRRLFILPGEVSKVYLTKGEVSRGHSSCWVVGNEPCLREQHGGITKQRRTEH
jgi:hypothetical protein